MIGLDDLDLGADRRFVDFARHRAGFERGRLFQLQRQLLLERTQRREILVQPGAVGRAPDASRSSGDPRSPPRARSCAPSRRVGLKSAAFGSVEFGAEDAG